jgi:hypothetical protein
LRVRLFRMTTADERASEAARLLARAKWRQQGDPVLTRSVETVVTRAADLDDVQRAAIVAAMDREES